MSLALGVAREYASSSGAEGRTLALVTPLRLPGAMALVLSTTLLLLGATAFLGSVLVVTTAAPDERFPVWSNPTTRRGASIGLRLVGVVLVTFSVSWGLGAVVGVWAAVPLAAAFAPGAAAVFAHNRAVGRRERASAAE